MGHLEADGYARLGVRHNGIMRRRKAHRLSYEAHYGAIPDGLSILHSCDTRSCLNPAHLRPGTHQDNMVDRRARRRPTKFIGERSSNPKLTEAAVRDIRQGRMNTIRYAALYGVSPTAINDVLHGHTWAHVA